MVVDAVAGLASLPPIARVACQSGAVGGLKPSWQWRVFALEAPLLEKRYGIAEIFFVE